MLRVVTVIAITMVIDSRLNLKDIPNSKIFYFFSDFVNFLDSGIFFISEKILITFQRLGSIDFLEILNDRFSTLIQEYISFF